MKRISLRAAIGRLAVAAPAALVLLAPARTASAQDPCVGYDLLKTDDGAGTTVNLPGFGDVTFHGQPLAGRTGNADTIMCRLQLDGAPLGDHLQLVALALKSDHSYPFAQCGPDQYDLWATINTVSDRITSVPQPDPLDPSTGTIAINQTDHTFDSDMDVHADLLLVRAGGDPRTDTVCSMAAADAVHLASSGSNWQETPPAGYPSPADFPANGFFPVRIRHTGPHPVVTPTCPQTGSMAIARGNNSIIEVCISHDVGGLKKAGDDPKR